MDRDIDRLVRCQLEVVASARPTVPAREGALVELRQDGGWPSPSEPRSGTCRARTRRPPEVSSCRVPGGPGRVKAGFRLSMGKLLGVGFKMFQLWRVCVQARSFLE